MNARIDGFAESRVMSYMEVLMTRKEILTAWSSPELLAGERKSRCLFCSVLNARGSA